jgi:hypothetical protein
MALTLHKREVLSVAYDSQSSQYCMTTAKDQTLIIYHLDTYYKQAKPICTQQISSIKEAGLSALCVVDKFASKKPVCYAALAEGAQVEVYAGVIDIEIELRSVVKITDA